MTTNQSLFRTLFVDLVHNAKQVNRFGAIQDLFSTIDSALHSFEQTDSQDV